MRGWGPNATEAALADAADRLADLVAQDEAALVVQLPRQLAHGDFWDDNVLFRHGRPVLLRQAAVSDTTLRPRSRAATATGACWSKSLTRTTASMSWSRNGSTSR